MSKACSPSEIIKNIDEMISLLEKEFIKNGIDKDKA